MAQPLSVNDRLDPTRSSLVQAVREADPDGWACFVRLYSGLVYSWCRRAGLDPNDSADILQEVFQAVHHGIVQFTKLDAPGTFRGWLKTITSNKIRDFFRHRAKMPTAAAGGSDAQSFLQQVPSPCPSLEGPPQQNAVGTGMLEEALASVSAEFEPRTWRAFWLATIDELAPADVARELGMSPGAVHTAKWRVLKKLREFLDGSLDSESEASQRG